jgi:hypothetical protein
MTLATSTRSEDRNANTDEMQFVTCSVSRSPAFSGQRISAVHREGPARGTEGERYSA